MPWGGGGTHTTVRYLGAYGMETGEVIRITRCSRADGHCVRRSHRTTAPDRTLHVDPDSVVDVQSVRPDPDSWSNVPVAGLRRPARGSGRGRGTSS